MTSATEFETLGHKSAVPRIFRLRRSNVLVEAEISFQVAHLSGNSYDEGNIDRFQWYSVRLGVFPATSSRRSV